MRCTLQKRGARYGTQSLRYGSVDLFKLQLRVLERRYGQTGEDTIPGKASCQALKRNTV